MRKGYTTIAAMVRLSDRDEIRALGARNDRSVSSLLAPWVRALLARSPSITRRSVRQHKDELMISLPREWIARTGVRKRDRLVVTATDDSLIVSIDR